MSDTILTEEVVSNSSADGDLGDTPTEPDISIVSNSLANGDLSDISAEPTPEPTSEPTPEPTPVFKPTAVFPPPSIPEPTEMPIVNNIEKSVYVDTSTLVYAVTDFFDKTYSISNRLAQPITLINGEIIREKETIITKKITEQIANLEKRGFVSVQEIKE